jgi:hypothetical protein
MVTKVEKVTPLPMMKMTVMKVWVATHTEDLVAFNVKLNKKQNSDQLENSGIINFGQKNNF